MSKNIELKVARVRAGLSQKALAEAAEVSKTTIYQIEAGKQQPSIDLAFKIAKILKEDIEILFDTKAA